MKFVGIFEAKWGNSRQLFQVEHILTIKLEMFSDLVFLCWFQLSAILTLRHGTEGSFSLAGIDWGPNGLFINDGWHALLVHSVLFSVLLNYVVVNWAASACYSLKTEREKYEPLLMAYYGICHVWSWCMIFPVAVVLLQKIHGHTEFSNFHELTQPVSNRAAVGNKL